MEEVLGEDDGFRKADYEGEEDMKGVDFSQVPLDKNTTKTLIEDDNFEF